MKHLLLTTFSLVVEVVPLVTTDLVEVVVAS
jgi:hypothetical protein